MTTKENNNTFVYTERKPSDSSDRKTNQSNLESQSNPHLQKVKLKTWHIILIIIGSFLVVGIIIPIAIIKNKGKNNNNNLFEKSDKNIGKGNNYENNNGKNNENNENNENDNGENSEKESSKIVENNEINQVSDDKEQYTLEELKQVFEPSFKINTNVDILSQMVMKSKQNLITKSNNISDYIFVKAKFDIYTLSESSPESEEESNFYTTKYTTSLAINSFCAITEGTDCEFIPYLDLTYKNDNHQNLRNVEDNIEEASIEDVILPICLFEHTDTNMIISVTCPNLLEGNLKNIIINAFHNIKPETIRGFKLDENLGATTIEKKDNKIYINSFLKLCDDNMENNDEICENNINIITGNDNLISCNKKITIETNSFFNESDYNFENITLGSSEILDHANYKSNLEKMLELLKNYMVKEIYFTGNSFKELMEPKENENNNNNIRFLREEIPENLGYLETNIFTTEYNSFKVSLNSSDNLISGDQSRTTTKINSISQKENNVTQLSYYEVSSNLTTIINEFKILSYASNSLATDLYIKLNNPLMELRDKINEEFSKLINCLPFKHLSDIYDSTLSISALKEFPYEIISASENVYNNIKTVNDDLIYLIDDCKTKLNNDISSFLTNSHNLIYNIFNNLRDYNSAISSKKSIIANIATNYCLNNTNNSFVGVVENAKNILDNYYIDEKNLIVGLLNEIFNNFSNNAINSINNGHYLLDNITNRLEDESVIIKRGDIVQIRNVIDNLYNTKILEKKIIPKIIEAMNKNIILSNGYLITQKVINDNKNAYTSIGENALDTAKKIAYNEYIDKDFDDIMSYFREQFVTILKNIEISKAENFPIKENILDSSISFDELDQIFSDNKDKIKEWMDSKKRNFTISIEDKINLFKAKNEIQLQNIMNNIYNQYLSKNNLNDLDIKYREMLSYIKGNISYIIDYDNSLFLAYLKDVAVTTHCTRTIRNKINIYLNNINEIKSYIQFNLKNDLVYKYKNIINQIRKNLQSIISNSIINKYYENNNLSLFKSHIDIYIKPLFLRLNDVISDDIFNEKYLNEINQYINSCINLINNLIGSYTKIYNPILKLTGKSESTNDIYYLYTWRCCKRTWYGKLKCHTCSEYHSKKVKTTNYHTLLKKIQFVEYSKYFDSKYNELVPNFSNDIAKYNDIVTNFGNELQIIINNYTFNNVQFLNIISEKAKSFLTDKLDINLLYLSYNYYKDQLKAKLPIELNSILVQWKSLYNKVYEDISKNINKFKYPIEQFGDLASIYYSFYHSNISYSYLDSVVEQRKTDFSYTIKYYYNVLISKVNKTYTFILNNIPVYDKPFNDVLNYQISQIENSYNELINLISMSKNKIMNLNNILNTLKVSETNFFEVNKYAVDISYKIESELLPLSEKFDEIVKKVRNQFDSQESLSSRFFLENLESEKQINEIYDTIDKGTFIDFQNKDYEDLFESILEIDEINLKNKILDFLTKSNEELKQIFNNKKKENKDRIQNYIYFKNYIIKVI